MTKHSRMEVPPPPEVLRQDGVVVEEADAKNRGVFRARRRHPLEYMQSIGSLTSRQVNDGLRFHLDWQRAMAGASASQYDGAPIPQSYYGRTPTEAVLRVVSRVNRVVAMLGWHEADICRKVIGEAQGLVAFAKARRMRKSRARSILAAALDQLCDAYDRIDAEARRDGCVTR